MKELCVVVQRGRALNDLFFKVSNVAQIQSSCFDHCEENHPCYEQSLIVSWQLTELQVKHNNGSKFSVFQTFFTLFQWR